MLISRPDVAIIVMTRNAGALWTQCLQGIRHQTVYAGRYLVMDSGSTDDTVEQALDAGFEVCRIDPNRFNHGGTRQQATQLCAESNFLVYLTQDAILEQRDSLQQLLSHFDDDQVALAYGRHVPHEAASLIEKHARLFTYPEQSAVRTRADFQTLGFRAAFSSDVYAAYRVSALRRVGGFPQHAIVSEDSYVAARLLLAGWKTAYSATAQVLHSHQYSLVHILQRYFDVGVFHANEAALLHKVGKPDQEAWVYVRSLIHYLRHTQPWLLPLAALQTLTKLIGFKLGKQYQRLPETWVKRISLQKAYWLQIPTTKAEKWRPVMSTSQ